MQHAPLALAFVVTFGAGGCNEGRISENPPPPEPTPETKQQASASEPSASLPRPSGSSAPSLGEAPAGKEIAMAADGTCSYLHVEQVDCPPNVPCNPPPPRRVTVACPAIPSFAKIERLEGGACEARWFPKCPEDVKCNPPQVVVDMPCDRAPKIEPR